MSKLIRKAVVDSETRRLNGSASLVEQQVNFSQTVGTTPEVDETFESEVEKNVPDNDLRVDELRLADIEKEAREKGFSAGFAEGKSDAVYQVEELVSVASKMIAALELVKQQYVEEVKNHMITAVHAAVLKIVGEVPEAVVNNTLNQILEKKNKERLISICLNQKDYETLTVNEAFSELYEYMMPDKRVTAGGCIVETHTGGTDARLETQLEEFTSLLSEYIETQHC